MDHNKYVEQLTSIGEMEELKNFAQQTADTYLKEMLENSAPIHHLAQFLFAVFLRCEQLHLCLNLRLGDNIDHPSCPWQITFTTNDRDGNNFLVRLLHETHNRLLDPELSPAYRGVNSILIKLPRPQDASNTWIATMASIASRMRNQHPDKEHPHMALVKEARDGTTSIVVNDLGFMQGKFEIFTKPAEDPGNWLLTINDALTYLLQANSQNKEA